ncbi:MAG TPA: CinA family protein [Chloroflexota bacterium]|nr:CinA family protein [Chloroflexota bacterium]
MSGQAEEELIASRSAALGPGLRARGWTLATAESCTGGGLSDAITNVAGSSDYFLGGVVSYSNAVKEALLGVDSGVLATQGAVSEPVARQMAEGVRRVIGADLGIGITGVAGPGGGSPGKPVGLVFIAVSGPAGTEVRRFQWGGDRIANKRHSVAAALEILMALL